MITKAMLERWQEAKNLAVKSFNIDKDVIIAMQEMYIEAKALRRDNLRLLNKEDLIDNMIQYVQLSQQNHYVDTEMEELYDEIKRLTFRLRIPLETDNDR